MAKWACFVKKTGVATSPTGYQHMDCVKELLDYGIDPTANTGHKVFVFVKVDDPSQEDIDMAWSTDPNKANCCLDTSGFTGEQIATFSDLNAWSVIDEEGRTLLGILIDKLA